MSDLSDKSVLFWNDRSSMYTGSTLMAIDELLHRKSAGLTLRCYRWAVPTITFGYFQSVDDIPSELAPEAPRVRRWTGGGVVYHLTDFTFSLTSPRGTPFSEMHPAQSYRWLHERIVSALRTCDISAELAGKDSGGGPACFQRPVVSDVLLGGRKIAGGAQRRSRDGILHQGTIQIESLPDAFGGHLAAALADVVTPFIPAPDFFREAESLAVEKYGSDSWLQLR